MKHLFLIACLALPVPAFAQEVDPLEDSELSEGFSLMEEGARLLFRGILNEMEPAIEDFSDLADELEPTLEMLSTEMGPALMELFKTLDSVRHYEAPEVLPNGDIIIRRSPDAPEFTPREPDEVIDL